MSVVSSNIKFLRSQTGLSQTAFGRIFEATRGMIDTYERGVADPSAAFISKLARHFKTSAEVIMHKNIQANPGLVVPGGHIEPTVNEAELLREIIANLKERVKFLEQLNAQQVAIIDRLSAARKAEKAL